MEAEAPSKRLSLEDALALLGLTELPGQSQHADQFLTTIQDLADRHGEQWVRRHAAVIVPGWQALPRRWTCAGPATSGW